MKHAKSYLLLLISLLLVSPVFSQDEMSKQQEPGLRLGMRLTPTISWFTSDEKGYADPSGAVAGYSFGMVGDWFFENNYAITSGLFMNSMGGEMTFNDMPVDIKSNDASAFNEEMSLRPTYLEIPIGFKFLTKEFWRVRVTGQCGYNQFILLNAKVGNAETSELESKTVSDEFTALAMAYHFGFGAEYSLGGSAYLTGGVMLNMGINDVTKSVSASGVDPVNKINSINFQLGVIF